jgi:hypothetical protein
MSFNYLGTSGCGSGRGIVRILTLTLLFALFPTIITAQVAAITGNHAISTPDLGLSIVQVNPSQFGVFISSLGTGVFTISIDGQVPIPLNNLTWSGEQLFPKSNVITILGDITISLNTFAPLSPFQTLQGFFPVIISSFIFENSVHSTTSHTIEIEYEFTCSGLATPCIGVNPPMKQHSSLSTFSSSLSSPIAFNSSNDVFIGVSGGDTVNVDCSSSNSKRNNITQPPKVNFTLIATDMAAQGPDCIFGGWGTGNSLLECEIGCVEDPYCNMINYNAKIGDCVFRVCVNPSMPNISSAIGYNVYSTLQGKGPYPLLCGKSSITLNPGNISTSDILFGYRDRNGKYNETFPDISSFFYFIAENTKTLAAQQSAFVSVLPLTGDPTTDKSIRWFLAPPVLLTKGVGNLTSTMGYVEMCPRDGFWTTFLHSYMWPGLEKDMIREFASFQCIESISECGGSINNGKIPTTVLPLIYRNDNIDITAYFILRIGRYFNETSDISLIQEVYDNIRNALLYLLSRRSSDGLPAAKENSQWADWLDVDYMIGRKYAPHFCFVTLEALREGAYFANLLNKQDDFILFSNAFTIGFDFMTHPIEFDKDGKTGNGMWNSTGGYFQDIWWDGRNTNYTLTDNSVGSFFNIISETTSQQIFQWLTRNGNEGLYGMRDFFPYFPNVDDPPAVYGNGGVYAWLTCIEATTRMLHGDYDGGVRIWNKMSMQMLYGNGQPAKNMAYEYMNGDTGLDMGAFPFGGDGACFMIASMGASSWNLLADGTHRLILRSRALQPPNKDKKEEDEERSLEIIRPFLDISTQSKDDSEGGGGGGRSFLRMIFKRNYSNNNNSQITIVKTSLITGAIWTKEYTNEIKHTWIEDETVCNDTNEEKIDDDMNVKGYSRLWKVSCLLFKTKLIKIEIQAGILS